MPEIRFRTDDEGFICEPEITDAAIASVHVLRDSIVLHVDIPQNDEMCFAITCRDVVASRIDNLTTQNISMDFFVCSDSNRGSSMMKKALLAALFDTARGISLTQESAELMLSRGTAVLFGNEPSSGCEIAVLCRSVELSRIKKSAGITLAT